MDAFTLVIGFIIGGMSWILSYLRPLLNPFIGDQPIMSNINEASNTPSTTTTRPWLRKNRLPNGSSAHEESTSSAPPSSPGAPYRPSISDVLRLRYYLLKASQHTLPITLIDEILDHASYWPHVSALKTHPIVARGATAHSDVLVIRTPPICALATFGSSDDRLGLPEPIRLHPARKIVFRIRSHDQGWSGEPPETKGTYRNSFTWFDAQIDKQFRPIPHGQPLSRVPWELSSTRFLEAWPGHRHQVDSEEEEEGEGEEAEETEETEEAENADADGQVAPSESGPGSAPETGAAGSEGASAGDAERTEPRLFSAAYLTEHRYEAQYNVQSQSQMTEHVFEWRWTDDTPAEGPGGDALAAVGRGRATGDGRFVRELRLGDCVSLWARARYPAWRNHVETASVEVYFAL